jgi:hypothetical protein
MSDQKACGQCDACRVFGPYACRRPGLTMFRVWDPLNEGEENAVQYLAQSPAQAAEMYADEDEGGRADGIYDQTHSLRVDDGSDVYEVAVICEYTPSFVTRGEPRTV